MIRWLRDWWRNRQRDIDLKILWPICKENASDIHMARAAFAFHAFNDEAWICLGEDEIKRRIDGLR